MVIFDGNLKVSSCRLQVTCCFVKPRYAGAVSSMQYAGGDGDPVPLWRNSWSDFGGDDDLSEGVERSGGVKKAAKMSQ
jgi:hypothetical protein